MGLIILACSRSISLATASQNPQTLGSIRVSAGTDRQTDGGREGQRGNKGVREGEEVERRTHYGDYSRSSVWMSII